ncbi:MAG: AAA family ATPase [Bacteroidales bacterium]|nr:AAA family ATPase [Bacteroidales bacterium]
MFSQKIAANFGHQPTQGQQALIGHLDNYFSSESNSIFLLRGYAGTGKTSMISALVRTLRYERIPVVLMAPTGRAAKVLSAYSGYRASTIHRRIYFALTDSNGNLVLKLQKNSLKNAVFLVDEASMIGNERSEVGSGARVLLDDLLQFVFSGENCRLILVGDVAQLPPVGLNVSPALNTVFLKNNYHYPVIKFELTDVVRQKTESGILHNATRLRQLMIAHLYEPPFFDIHPFLDVVVLSPNELPDIISSCYSSVGQDDTVIITRSNKAAYQYNMAIRNQILARENELEAGDVLMVVKNNYFWLDDDSEAGFLANGDLIEVESVRNEQEEYGFRFAEIQVKLLDYPDAESVSVKVILDSLTTHGPALSSEQNNMLYQNVLADFSDIGDAIIRKEKVRNSPYFNAVQIKYAYAMTCHKTQGGQWNTIFIDPGYFKDQPLDLEFLRWLYTALTRATTKVYLLNFPTGFLME